MFAMPEPGCSLREKAVVGPGMIILQARGGIYFSFSSSFTRSSSGGLLLMS